MLTDSTTALRQRSTDPHSNINGLTSTHRMNRSNMFNTQSPTLSPHHHSIAAQHFHSSDFEPSTPANKHPSSFRSNLLYGSLFLLLLALIFLMEYLVDESLHAHVEHDKLTESTLNGLDFTTSSSSSKVSSQQSVVTVSMLLERSRQMTQLLEQHPTLLQNATTQQTQSLLSAYNSLIPLLNPHSTPLLDDESRVVEAIRNETANQLAGESVKVSVERVTRVDDEGNQLPVEEETVEQHAVHSNTTLNTTQHHTDRPVHTAAKLIDSERNEYILSAPAIDKSTGDVVQSIDNRLIVDLGIVIVASAMGGVVASLLHQPVLIGYLLSGSIIGPGGLKLIGQFVQVETLAQFGATFLLFALGVEFQLSRLLCVKWVACCGGLLSMLAITIVTTGICTTLLSTTLKQALFIGLVLSMSSTTVVFKQLTTMQWCSNQGCTHIMLGLLIVQDIVLSVLLAVIPLSRVSVADYSSELVMLALKFIFLSVIVLTGLFVYPIVLRLLAHSQSHDLFLLGLVALCIALTVASEKLIESAEVGAFLSGILISNSPYASATLTDRSMKLFTPIRDMFSALFFSSIGMLINANFLLNHSAAILTGVVAILILKSLLIGLCVKMFHYEFWTCCRVGVYLCQIGEFSFVLASELLKLKLITHAIYRSLLGVTVLSIFVTPLCMKVCEMAAQRYDPHFKAMHFTHYQRSTQAAENAAESDVEAMMKYDSSKHTQFDSGPTRTQSELDSLERGQRSVAINRTNSPHRA